MKTISKYFALAAIVVASMAHGKASYLDQVDPFIGTGGNGHTTPAAAYPFGMVQPGPDTGHEGWERCSGYQYGDKAIKRFSQNHLSGTGCSEFGDLGFMPSAEDPKEALERDYSARFEKRDEKASPGYYAVRLACGTKVEATCTRRVSFFRFTFPKGKRASLLFDPSWSFSKIKSVQVSPMEKRCVSGHIDREGWPGHEYYFAWEISVDPISSRVVDNIKVENGIAPKSVYEFDISKNNVVYLKVALSRTSVEGARRNINEEIPEWDFDGVLAANRAVWRDILGRVKAKGEPHKIKNLYTAIYHLCFQPNLMTDVGEDDLYSTFSCWDTYRAAGPLYTILTPEYVPAFINSMLWHFENNGFLPVWALWGGDNQCMTGVHSVPMIVDAYLKWGTGNGERGTVDWSRAYEYVKATLSEDRGRCDAEYEMLDKYGYFPCDFMDEESVSRLLESCYDDACAARFAAALGGREADAKFFLDRSRTWTNCFDAATGFIRAKDSKGAWREPFDPYAIDGKGLHNYTEGNAFHWNWHVMQEPNLLIEMLGGKSAALKRLEGLFCEDSGRNEGELSDVTGLVGQYCQGNEPCHHDIYFFTLMGRRDLAAKYIGEVMETQYYPSPTGLCGNEDCGQMSAWYIFSAMGFYPFDPCGGEYVLGEAQLDEIKLRVGSDGVGEFRIVRGEVGDQSSSSREDVIFHSPTPTQNSNSTLQLQLNSPTQTIRHEDIMKGGTLAFVGGGAKYDYVVDTSAAPELDQWMRTKMVPAVRKWYPKLVEMFPSEGWEATKTITFNFNAGEDSPPAYTVGNVVTFGRKWIKGNPGDVGCGIHELFHVVQDDYPDEKTFWLQEGIADYVRWYLYEPESHGCDMDLTSDDVHYDGAYRESANFLDFVERRYPGTVRELNALCRQGKYDEETYWKKRTGKGVKELETEWKNQSKQPFRNYRFCVDRTKSPSDSTQLSEFELLDTDGKVIPSDKFELGFDGRGGDDNFGNGEKPECAVDGNLDTKWLDFRASAGGNAARRSAVWIQFKFVEPTKILGYRWYTANDDEDRDPRDWRLLGSNDGVNWVVVDKVEDFEATSDRKKLAFTKDLHSN